MADRLFPDDSTLKFRNFRWWDCKVEPPPWRKGSRRAKRSPTIALFNWRLSKVIILSTATARISLLRERLKGDNRNRDRRVRRKGLDCRYTLCGQHYSLRALSAPTLIAVFVAAPTIPLPFPYTQAYSSIPRILQSTFCILAVYTLEYSDSNPAFLAALFIISCPRFNLPLSLSLSLPLSLITSFSTFFFPDIICF